MRVDAPRGLILDRNGNILVGNIEGTAVELWPADLPKTGPLPDARSGSAEYRRACDQDGARESTLRRRDPLTPVVVKRDPSTAPRSPTSASTQREFPGVELIETHLRDYPYGTLAAHVLGHVGEIARGQPTKRRTRSCRRDKIGQAGVEAAYDATCAARPGFSGSTSTRSAAAQRPHAAEDADARNPLTADDRHRAPAGGRAGARARDPDRARLAVHRRVLGRERRRDRRARPARRRDPRARVDPDLRPAVFVGAAEVRSAPLVNEVWPKRKNYPGLNRALAGSIRRARRSSRSRRSRRSRSRSSRRTTASLHAVVRRGENGVLYKFDNWDPT